MNNSRLLLLPLSWIFWLIVKIRHFLFNIKLLKEFSFDIPTICVGNITVGGTGKTPHADYIIDLLSKRFNIGFLSRGYGRKSKGFKMVLPESTSTQVGDEPLQLKLKHPNVDFAVDENRVNGIIALLYQNSNIDAIVLDDAFQHRWIKAGVNIVLTDYGRLATRDYFLPAGNLRDSVSELKRAQIIIVTKCPNPLNIEIQAQIARELRANPNQSIYFTTFEYGNLIPVFGDRANEIPISKTQNIFGLAGIAQPKPFFKHIAENALLVGNKTYPDHHDFSVKEILSIFEIISKRVANDGLLVVTEKDAARIRNLKLSAEIKEKIYYLPITVRFINNDADSFNSQLINYVGENKTNSSLHQD
ncbi:MAG: tetraacyldisaccharide 4'-kinase [Bacteroidales bacterium]|nr:tetraacyldisaccharide 4'-kinase [Bacteroidales bacterium]HPD94497.1 tetraacyldisaccharide 4'-kinase [Tenuifilaceae bacterium]HRX32312.1 tetraacyldisaccharide 4'-kinase [Tenuifilaceae bacterium]